MNVRDFFKQYLDSDHLTPTITINFVMTGKVDIQNEDINLMNLVVLVQPKVKYYLTCHPNEAHKAMREGKLNTLEYNLINKYKYLWT